MVNIILVKALGLFLHELWEAFFNLGDNFLDLFDLLLGKFLCLRGQIFDQHFVLADGVFLLRIGQVLDLFNNVLLDFLFNLFLLRQVKVELAFDSVREATISLVLDHILN